MTTHKTTAQRREDALLDFRNEAIDRANAAEAKVKRLSEQLRTALSLVAELRADIEAANENQAAQEAITRGNSTPCDCGIECACAERKDAS